MLSSKPCGYFKQTCGLFLKGSFVNKLSSLRAQNFVSSAARKFVNLA